MMDDPEAEYQSYRPAALKVALNLLLCGLGLFAGLMLILAGSGLALCGGPVILVCLLATGLTLWNQVGRELRLYKDGVQVRRLAYVRRWRLDELDDVELVVPEDYISRFAAYRFYAQGKVAFSIGASFPAWRELGETLERDVLRRRIEGLMQQLDRGETVTLQVRVSGLFRSPLRTLYLSRVGFALGNSELVPWSEVQKVEAQEAGLGAAVRIFYQSKRRIILKYHNGPGAILAYRLMQRLRV
jgi:hypothetical protein